MKKLVLLTIAALLFFTTCFSPWQEEEEGSITINFGANSRSATLWPPQEHGLLDKIDHVITLTSSGKTDQFHAKGGETIRRTVAEGRWNIKIDDYLEGVETPITPDSEKIYYAAGSNIVDVVKRQNTTVIVQMDSVCLDCQEYPCICDNTGIIITYPSARTVTFSPNGGNGTIPSQSIETGESITLPDGSGLSKEGYIFMGWVTLENPATILTSPYTPSGNITLYAQWRSDGIIVDPFTYYTVTFSPNGGNGAIPSRTIEAGESITLPDGSGLSRTGYAFNGWMTAANSQEILTSPYTPTGNVTLFAQWRLVTYTVTFDSKGGTPVDPFTGLSYEVIINEPTAPTRTGVYLCVFDGWYRGNMIDEWDFDTDTVSADITLYAKWRPYEIGETGPGGGTIFYRIEQGFTMTDDNSTAHYLEVAPVSMEGDTLAWSINGSSSHVGGNIGGGRNSTALILSQDPDAPAAKACADFDGGGLSDWFLPNRSELEVIRSIPDKLGLTGIYWTSTSYSGTSSSVYYVDMTNGTSSYVSQTTVYNVRAVRAF